MITAAIIETLLNMGAITDVFGNRIYPGILPQDPVLPVLTVTVIGQDENVALASVSKLKHARVQIDVWGKSYADAAKGRELLVNSLNDYKGVALGLDMAVITLYGGIYRYEDAVNAHRRTTDFSIWFNKI